MAPIFGGLSMFGGFRLWLKWPRPRVGHDHHERYNRHKDTISL